MLVSTVATFSQEGFSLAKNLKELYIFRWTKLATFPKTHQFSVLEAYNGYIMYLLIKCTCNCKIYTPM
jgi:hypothetical protein